jgi:hypothetical protein
MHLSALGVQWTLTGEGSATTPAQMRLAASRQLPALAAANLLSVRQEPRARSPRLTPTTGLATVLHAAPLPTLSRATGDATRRVTPVVRSRLARTPRLAAMMAFKPGNAARWAPCAAHCPGALLAALLPQAATTATTLQAARRGNRNGAPIKIAGTELHQGAFSSHSLTCLVSASSGSENKESWKRRCSYRT